MEWIVHRIYDGGRVMPAHVRAAGRTRGKLSIRQEQDPIRRRMVLVARMSPAPGQRSLPPLYDAMLVSCNGEVWTLTGIERTLAGPLRDEHALAQSWVCEAAPVDDLIRAEAAWCGALSDLQRLRDRLVAVGIDPIDPDSIERLLAPPKASA